MAGRRTPATALLSSQRIKHRVHAYEHDPRAHSYGFEAAEALGQPPQRVFKTLVAEVDGVLTVGVVAVTDQLDLKALAAARGGKKARLADTGTAERVTGYVTGGISPLGQKRKLPTVVDSSVTNFDTVYLSAGRRGLEIELAPHDLLCLTDAIIAAVSS